MCVLEEIFLILTHIDMAFHEHAALFLQTGAVNEETEVISLGTEQVPDVPFGHFEFQWLLRNLFKDPPGALPGFLQSLLQSTTKRVQLWWRSVWRGQACWSLPTCRTCSLVCWTHGRDHAGISSCGGERAPCLANLSPVEIKRG